MTEKQEYDVLDELRALPKANRMITILEENKNYDVIGELRALAGAKSLIALHKLFTAAADEIERCHERLEIDHYYSVKVVDGKLDDSISMEQKVIVPYDDRMEMIDGIEARDCTIANLEELRKSNDRKNKSS